MRFLRNPGLLLAALLLLEAAGFRTGDLLTAVDGVTDVSQMRRRLWPENCRENQTLVVRDGNGQERRLVLKRYY